MPKKEYHQPRVSRETFYQPFIDAAHRIATNLFGPRYHEYLKKTNEGEVLRHILLHMIDEDYRSKTNLKKTHRCGARKHLPGPKKTIHLSTRPVLLPLC